MIPHCFRTWNGAYAQLGTDGKEEEIRVIELEDKEEEGRRKKKGGRKGERGGKMRRGTVDIATTI